MCPCFVVSSYIQTEKDFLSKSQEIILTESLLELPSSILNVLDMSEIIKGQN